MLCIGTRNSNRCVTIPNSAHSGGSIGSPTSSMLRTISTKNPQVVKCTLVVSLRCRRCTRNVITLSSSALARPPDRDIPPAMNAYDHWAPIPGVPGEPLENVAFTLKFEAMGAQVCVCVFWCVRLGVFV